MSDQTSSAGTGWARSLVTEGLAAVALVLGSASWLCRENASDFIALASSDRFVLIALGVAYFASGAGFALRERGGAVARSAEATIWAVAFVAAMVVWLDLRHHELARQTIALAIGLSVGLAWLREALRDRVGVHRVVLLVLIAAGALHGMRAGQGAFEEPGAHLAPRFIDSHHYGLELRSRPLPALLKPGGGIPIPPNGYQIEPGGGIREGGGVVARPGGYLLVSGAGDFYWITEPDPEADLEVRELDIDVPLNAEAFERATGSDPVVRYWNFRVQDVEVRERDEGVQVYASHHYWHDERGCYVVRVSTFESSGPLAEATANVDWRTLFESTPCMTVKDFPRGQRFAGEESGGRLALLGDDTLLVTLGDHEHDGLNSPTAMAQNRDASYGKIIAISLAPDDEGRARLHSIGHRNPQGLVVDVDGVVWSTEHGPEGGDELNRIEAGGNYGWPLVSYGVDYGETTWPLAQRAGSHAGYVEPVYAWVPSIGVSNLVGVDSPLFPVWRGDLLVTSLRDRGLWRMRVRNGGLVVNERIEIGVRMRDIIQGHQGEIVIYSDENPQLVFLSPAGELATPEAAFAICRGCHTTVGDASAIGPNLRGIVGREIASYPGYAYSTALGAREGRWREAELDAYLRDPQAFAPGTSMAMPGIEDAEHRALVIEYLEQL